MTRIIEMGDLKIIDSPPKMYVESRRHRWYAVIDIGNTRKLRWLVAHGPMMRPKGRI